MWCSGNEEELRLQYPCWAVPLTVNSFESCSRCRGKLGCNNNHTESLRWWKRKRKGENNRLATVGTGLGCLNISAAGWGTLCRRVWPQQVSRCPSLLLFFPCNCLDLCFTKDQNIVQIFMWGAVWSENLSIWLERFLAGSEKVQKKAVIVHL